LRSRCKGVHREATRPLDSITQHQTSLMAPLPVPGQSLTTTAPPQAMASIVVPCKKALSEGPRHESIARAEYPREFAIRWTIEFNETGSLELPSRAPRSDDLDIVHLASHEGPCTVANNKHSLQNTPADGISVSSPSSGRFQNSSPTVISRKAYRELRGVRH
jgi:hypothetical protein